MPCFVFTQVYGSGNFYNFSQDEHRIKENWNTIGENARRHNHAKDRYKTDIARRLKDSETERSK